MVRAAAALRAEVRAVGGGIADEARAMGETEQVCAGLLLTYVVVVTVFRFTGILGEWASEGDWRQWIFQYWRYTVDGAFPPGDLLTDYIFACQPPLYWAMMASLSSFMTPAHAAFVVNLASWSLLLGAVFLGVRGRTTLLVALLATALLVRDVDIFRWSAGGYPRSFGPGLVAWFLGAWLNGRFRLALSALVVGAGLYPSVVVPCGLALGAATALEIVGVVDVRAWLRRVGLLAIGAVVIAVFAESQNLLAEDWWGPVVRIGDTGIESTRAGRWNWAPLPALLPSIVPHLTEVFARGGSLTLSTAPFQIPDFTVPLRVYAVVVVVVCVSVLAVRAPRALPWRLLLFFACVFVAYVVARELAFKLYYPKRIVQHTLPLFSVWVLTLLVVRAAAALGVRRQMQALALFVAIVAPTALLAGDGVQTAGIFGEKSRWSGLYRWAREHTALTDRFAGDYQTMDWLPLYAYRRAYVNFTLAHPARAGYFAEIKRRTLAVYDALYATDLRDVLRFCDAEDVRWFVVDVTLFNGVESGWGRLFEPFRSEIVALFDARQPMGFALKKPPPEVIAWSGGEHRVIDREKLRSWLRSSPPPASSPPSSSP